MTVALLEQAVLVENAVDIWVALWINCGRPLPTWPHGQLVPACLVTAQPASSETVVVERAALAALRDRRATEGSRNLRAYRLDRLLVDKDTVILHLAAQLATESRQVLLVHLDCLLLFEGPLHLAEERSQIVSTCDGELIECGQEVVVVLRVNLGLSATDGATHAVAS